VSLLGKRIQQIRKKNFSLLRKKKTKWRILPILTDYFNAGSACVGKLLAQAQPA
jgi:hypothetical protein